LTNIGDLTVEPHTKDTNEKNKVDANDGKINKIDNKKSNNEVIPTKDQQTSIPNTVDDVKPVNKKPNPKQKAKNKTTVSTPNKLNLDTKNIPLKYVLDLPTYYP